MLELARFQTENKRLEVHCRRLAMENTVLQDYKSRLEREVEKLENDKISLKSWNEEILSSVGQALKNYGETFDKFDFDGFDGYQHEETVSFENLQIGSGNTQNIFTTDLQLFGQYQKYLENIMQELKQTKQSLQISKTFQENMGNQILTLDGVLEEVKGALTDVKNTKKHDVSMELLDYTLSWIEPRLMSECVNELQNLPEKSSDYLFDELTGNAKIGVLRIFKKYEKKMNFRRFVQRLEMDDAINNDMFCADIPLTKDACASLLVKWVRLQENDADTLVERFPRIKPGRGETKRDKAIFPFPIASYSTESLNSNDDLVQKSEQFRERLIRDMKDIVQQEIHGLKPELEEIKSVMLHGRSEPQFV
ncbi:uncharacterized protein LOC132729312 [Ruditapes philippinarum]|uniref:uncharacterized protein LOC132729312 n=1 Tax=Ruditapes philippinarum TaxID=129788 RepID=UPI00295BEB68|nr:uncharacterized protein LOC132729312 [Ruditapes philippinarum]